MDAKCPGATNLLLFEAIKWAKKERFRIFDLGGGNRQGDSLYNFKTSFSKNVIDFYIYCKVQDEQKYKQLCDAKDQYDKAITPSEYFPYYRR